jgi:hypothetical protein
MNKDFPCVCSHSKEKHNPYMFKQRQFSPESYLQTACYYVTNGGIFFVVIVNISLII